MAASRKGKQIATRPITRTPSETATQTEDIRGLRLCHLRRWQNFKGYGFDVKVDEKGHGFMIHRVDIHSPAELGGLAKDDRLLEVNGTSVEGKTLLEVVDLIEEDPLKVDVLVIDKETEQEFAKRREVPSRKSAKLVFKTAPPEMPITPRQKNQAVGRKPPGALSGSTRIVAIGKLSAEPSPPMPDNTGKSGNKGKPAKPAIPKVTAKSKAAAKGGTKANAAEVSKAEAKLLKKFALARGAENADAYMPYSLPGSPFWSPPVFPGILPYQTPYMPFMQMSGLYGFPYVSPTYPDFSAYAAPFPSYPYTTGGEANQYDDGAEEGADVSQHDAGSSRSHKEVKWSKDKPAKSKAKDQGSPSAPHLDHKPDKTP